MIDRRWDLSGISRRLFGSEWHPIEDVMRWQASWLPWEEYSFQFLRSAREEGCREARQRAMLGGVSARRCARERQFSTLPPPGDRLGSNHARAARAGS